MDRKTIRIPTYIAWLGVVVFTSACEPERALEFRFSNQALRQASTELRGFVYDVSQSELSCDTFEPTGNRPGDAAQRSGIEPTRQFSAAVDKVQFEAAKLANTQQLIILEAWSQKLIEGKTQSTLLAFSCQIYDLRNLQTSVVITLKNYVDSDSTILVPENRSSNGERIDRYDESEPLYLTDGVSSRTPFTVQLLDGVQQNVVDYAVHFEVIKGAAHFGQGQRQTIVNTNEQGLAEIAITMHENASRSDESTIEIRAHAAGYVGGPIHFFAKAIRSIRPQLHHHALNRNQYDFSDVLTTRRYFANYQPLISADLNGDGRTDLVTAAGTAEHRIIMFYANDDGGYTIYPTDPKPGVVTTLTTFNARAGEPISLVAASTAVSGRQIKPALHTLHNSGRSPTESGFEWTITSTESNRSAISLTSYDIDGDGDDDLAAVRCSKPLVTLRCTGTYGDSPDNDLVVLTNLDGIEFKTSKTIHSPVAGGGFRKIVFADLDQNGSPDLMATTTQQVHGFCGNRNRPDYGFNERFTQNVTLGHVGPMAIGHFNDDQLPDLATMGAYRLNATSAEFRVMHGCQNCGLPPTTCGLKVGPASQPLGSRSFAYYQQDLRVLDLNADGHDDLINLHRTETAVYTYLSNGKGTFAVGPRIELPLSRSSEMTVYQENGNTYVAMIDPDQNTLLILELAPD